MEKGLQADPSSCPRSLQTALPQENPPEIQTALQSPLQTEIQTWPPLGLPLEIQMGLQMEIQNRLENPLLLEIQVRDPHRLRPLQAQEKAQEGLPSWLRQEVRQVLQSQERLQADPQ